MFLNIHVVSSGQSWPKVLPGHCSFGNIQSVHLPRPQPQPLGCIAGGIVGVRAVEPLIVRGEAVRNTTCQRTWVF